MTHTALPKGFFLRSQGGSTFLEIDLSHLDDGEVFKFARAVADAQGYRPTKPRRTVVDYAPRPGKGRRDR